MEDFEAWVSARAPALARTAYVLTGDVHLAEDLVQETLARVAQRWRRLDHSSSPDAYARQVMHRLSIDAWRRRRARPVEVLSAEHPELRGASHDADVEQRVVLLQALARLTPRQRAVLCLRYFEDLTERQTSEVLGCSVNTVKSQTRDALARVRQISPDLLASYVDAAHLDATEAP